MLWSNKRHKRVDVADGIAAGDRIISRSFNSFLPDGHPGPVWPTSVNGLLQTRQAGRELACVCLSKLRAYRE